MKHFKPLLSILLTILFIPLTAVPAVAQVAGDPWFADGFGHFFLAVIAGILLAFAFQFILTNLAVASGITAMGDVREMGRHDRSSSSSKNKDRDRDDPDATPMGVKISSGFGIFLTATMAISLFFASLIAIKLTLTSSNLVGITLGLVIWAGYLLLGLYIDSKMVSSLTGSVFSAVKEMLNAGSSAVGNMFSSSERSQAKDTARDTVKEIHDEIRQEYDLSGIEKKLDEYMGKLEPQRLNMDKVQNQLVDLIQDIQVREEYSPEDPETVRHLFLEVAGEQPNLSRQDKQKLKNAFEKASEIAQQEGSKADKAISAVNKFTPGGEEQGKKYWEKVKQYLQNTHEEELQPEKLKEDLNEILNHPEAAPDVVRARAENMDRSTLKSMLSSVEGMTDQKAEQYLSQAEEVLEGIKSRADDVQEKSGEARQRAGDVQEESKHRASETRERAERSIRDWFNRMDQPELQYDRLKHDARRIFDDPKTAPSVLRNRLQRMDRESLIALVSNNQRISREQAERVVDKIEEGRDEVLQKVDEIERTVKEKAEKARQETIWQAEHARKTAASAAWWMFIATVVSGGASALGGMLALTT
ncbi:MAG: hypothetical protein WEA56_15820 [Balneolaceae bacterium]